jgi:hypothetical protein
MTVDSEGGSIFKRWKGVSFQPVLTLDTDASQYLTE